MGHSFWKPLRLRENERADFSQMLAPQNSSRTAVVGAILWAFAALAAVLELFSLLSGHIVFYLIQLMVMTFGLTLIFIAQRSRMEIPSRFGEYIVITAAIVWMYFAVRERVEVGYGLSEFVIGVLALAMLRNMRPYHATAAFLLLSAGYAGVLYHAGYLELQPWMNGLLFCIFAILLSWNSYNAKVHEFRSQQLAVRLAGNNRVLQALAMQDPLTKLPNRRYFDSVLERWQCEPDGCVEANTLILADIDRFKEYNDAHGHPEGDRCLQQVAHALSQAIRHEGAVCRLGGEEFAVILEGVTAAEAGIAAERLRREVALRTPITMSFGLAEMHPGDRDYQDIYQRADAALYRAKQAGRDRVMLDN